MVTKSLNPWVAHYSQTIGNCHQSSLTGGARAKTSIYYDDSGRCASWRGADISLTKTRHHHESLFSWGLSVRNDNEDPVGGNLVAIATFGKTHVSSCALAIRIGEFCDPENWRVPHASSRSIPGLGGETLRLRMRL